RQSHAAAAQRGLQSALERDVDDRGSSATSTAHESAASREPRAADPRLLVPRLLGSTAVSAVPSTGPPCHLIGSSGQPGATRSSSWHGLFLAPTLSQTPSLQPCGFSRALCKQMKRTPTRMVSSSLARDLIYFSSKWVNSTSWF